MIDAAEVQRSVEKKLAELDEGYFATSVTVSSGNDIEVEIDHDSKDVDIDTCVAISRHVEASLDRDAEDFSLSVSSAGLTTPITSPRRFRKFLGRPLDVLVRGGRKMHGTLSDVTEEGIGLEVVYRIRPEGAKRKEEVTKREELRYGEILKATYHIDF